MIDAAKRRPPTAPALAAAAAALLLASHGPAVAAVGSYTNDFEVGDSFPEWSSNKVSVTPGTLSHLPDRFLGNFGNGESNTVTLTLGFSQAHTEVTLSFDLYAIYTWDGNDQSAYGPDRFTVQVVGGPTLLDTTFSNVTSPPFGIPFLQSYPDAYFQGNHPQFTGSFESRTLGYQFGGYNVDSVYRLSYTFPSVADSVAIRFTMTHNGTIAEESFGLDNVSVLLGERNANPYGISNAAARHPIIHTASAHFDFRVWGKVLELDATGLRLDDGSRAPIWVDAPGASGVAVGDMATASGQLADVDGQVVMQSQAGDVKKLD